jgi:hypothetical protein
VAEERELYRERDYLWQDHDGWRSREDHIDEKCERHEAGAGEFRRKAKGGGRNGWATPPDVLRILDGKKKKSGAMVH